MAEKKSAKKGTQRPAKRTASGKASKGFTPEERAAMRATVRERKLAGNKAAQEKAVLEAIAAMPEPDRSVGKRLHALIKATAPARSEARNAAASPTSPRP